ncbi:MAG: hypothetical protein E7679_00915 [Ruminococcaceae bacterium]|nr:hypothetical protein [Oscillospiraceae bacterium]
MSEFEKLQRDTYQKKRKLLILIQAIAICVLTVALLITSLTYIKMNKSTYVYYSESGNALYRAYLADNEFYEQEYLNGEHAYVSELIDRMTGDFSYDLVLDTSDVNFKYSYRIEAQVIVSDKDTGANIYDPSFILLPEKAVTTHGNGLAIRERVNIDYNSYEELAAKFVGVYGLTNVEQKLCVRMFVDVLGTSESFADDSSGQYVVELKVPLNAKTLKPSVSTTIATGEQKILANNTSAKNGFKIASIIIASLDAVAVAAIAVFTILTRDKHIDYSRKVKSVVSSYRSYIQKIVTPFDTEGYQLLAVESFREMLEIRDTIQMPILMYENEDRTCTTFMIPTASKFLYIFEIKVEDLNIELEQELTEDTEN